MDFAKPFDEDDYSAEADPTHTHGHEPVQLRTFVSVAFVRQVLAGPYSWYQVFVEKRKRPFTDEWAWAFPQGCFIEEGRGCDLPNIRKTVQMCVDKMRRHVGRGLHIRDYRAIQEYTLRNEVPDVINQPTAKSIFVVFRLREEEHADMRKFREPHPPPEAMWITESELADHALIGEPRAYGYRVCPFTIANWQHLPTHLQFASSTPPLVLYHGTGLSYVEPILRLGLKPGGDSDSAMLGPGIYLARWDKARDFAFHTVDNIPRMEPGVVFRVIVCGAASEGTVLVLTADHVCLCGCARAFVDHTGVQGRGYAVTAVPDNAGSATRRAEWCVHASASKRILLDGCCFV